MSVRGGRGLPPSRAEDTGDTLHPAVILAHSLAGDSPSSDPSFLSPSLPPRESRLSTTAPTHTRLRNSSGERRLLLQAGRPRVSSSLSLRAAGLLAAHPQLPFPRLASPLPSAAGGGDLHWFRVGPKGTPPRVRFCSCRYLRAPLQDGRMCHAFRGRASHAAVSRSNTRVNVMPTPPRLRNKRPFSSVQVQFSRSVV